MVSFYNLEVIIPVGYRVHSYNGILFRRWANRILKEYLLKGYAKQVDKRTLITNENYVNLEVTPRKEIKMFDIEAFEQAWINACVHNKWSESNHPGIYVYSNRLETESFGGIPKALTKEQFLKGKSEPVNKQLFDVFRSCNFAEESGHGVPSVVSRYGEDAYVFSEYFIDVIIPFNKNGFGVTTRKNDSKQPEKIIESIIDLLSSNNRLSRKDLSLLLGVG